MGESKMDLHSENRSHCHWTVNTGGNTTAATSTKYGMIRPPRFRRPFSRKVKNGDGSLSALQSMNALHKMEDVLSYSKGTNSTNHVSSPREEQTDVRKGMGRSFAYSQVVAVVKKQETRDDDDITNVSTTLHLPPCFKRGDTLKTWNREESPREQPWNSWTGLWPKASHDVKEPIKTETNVSPEDESPREEPSNTWTGLWPKTSHGVKESNNTETNVSPEDDSPREEPMNTWTGFWPKANHDVKELNMTETTVSPKEASPHEEAFTTWKRLADEEDPDEEPLTTWTRLSPDDSDGDETDDDETMSYGSVSTGNTSNASSNILNETALATASLLGLKQCGNLNDVDDDYELDDVSAVTPLGAEFFDQAMRLSTLDWTASMMDSVTSIVAIERKRKYHPRFSV